MEFIYDHICLHCFWHFPATKPGLQDSSIQYLTGEKMILNRTFLETYLQNNYCEINIKIKGFPSFCQWQSTGCSRLTKDKTTLQFSVNHTSSAKATTNIKLKRGIKGPTRINDKTDISLRALREETLVYRAKDCFIMLETQRKKKKKMHLTPDIMNFTV